MCVDSANCDGNCSECQYDSIKRLRAQVAALTKDNDDIHELAEHYRVENGRLREALDFITEEHDAGRHDGLPEPCPAHDAETMFAVARAALSKPQ